MRIPLDFYETPQLLTELLLKNQPAIKGYILEPCCGAGAISDYLAEKDFRVQATDIKDGAEFDATQINYWDSIARPAHWIITNPPFSQATIILNYSLNHAETGVAMLLRLTYLEPCRDRCFLLQKYSDNMVQIIPVNPRPRFNPRNKGTDNATVAWVVWNKNFSWRELGLKSPFKFEGGWR